jgi:hypothetical protein
LDDKFTARFEVTEADFDTLSEYDIQTFLNFVAGALAGYEEGMDGEGSIGIARAIEFLRGDRAAIPEFNSNINSPGTLRLLSSKTTPIVIAALLSIALATGDASAATVNVINSKGPLNDPCALKIQEQVRATIRLMGILDLHEACKRAVSAQEKTGLKTSMSTVVSKGPGAR